MKMHGGIDHHQHKVINFAKSLKPSKRNELEIVNLLNILEHNPSVTKTKYWEKIRLQHRPNSSNIKIGIIKTNAIKKTYIQETS